MTSSKSRVLSKLSCVLCIDLYRDRRFFSKTVSLISQLLNKIERCSTSVFKGHEILGVVEYVRITQVDHVGCDVTWRNLGFLRRLEIKTVRLISQLLNKIERRSTSGFNGHEISDVVWIVRITQINHVGCDITWRNISFQEINVYNFYTASIISQLLNKIKRYSTSGFEGLEILGAVWCVRIIQVEHVGCDVTWRNLGFLRRLKI